MKLHSTNQSRKYDESSIEKSSRPRIGNTKKKKQTTVWLLRRIFLADNLDTIQINFAITPSFCSQDVCNWKRVQLFLHSVIKPYIFWTDESTNLALIVHIWIIRQWIEHYKCISIILRCEMNKLKYITNCFSQCQARVTCNKYQRSSSMIKAADNTCLQAGRSKKK